MYVSVVAVPTVRTSDFLTVCGSVYTYVCLFVGSQCLWRQHRCALRKATARTGECYSRTESATTCYSDTGSHSTTTAADRRYVVAVIGFMFAALFEICFVSFVCLFRNRSAFLFEFLSFFAGCSLLTNGCSCWRSIVRYPAAVRHVNSLVSSSSSGGSSRHRQQQHRSGCDVARTNSVIAWTDVGRDRRTYARCDASV